MIYLDNNATTKIDNIVFEEMLPFFQGEYANASSIYEFAKRPFEALKVARVQVRDFIGARDEKEIIFTSCGSESANMAIKGVVNCNKEKRHLITTKIEHPCVLNTYKEFESDDLSNDMVWLINNKLRLDFLKKETEKLVTKQNLLPYYLN